MRARRFLVDQRGAAAAEMALLVPLLLTLMFGGFEAGHFVWTQHKLAEAVRDGARFAGRFHIETICNDDGTVKTDATAIAAVSSIKLLTRTGQIANATTDDNCTGSGGAKPKVCGWTDAEVDVGCGAFVDTGIYGAYGKAGYVLRIEASDVKYPSFFQGLGIIDPMSDLTLSASSNAPVIGL